MFEIPQGFFTYVFLECSSDCVHISVFGIVRSRGVWISGWCGWGGFFVFYIPSV